MCKVSQALHSHTALFYGIITLSSLQTVPFPFLVVWSTRGMLSLQCATWIEKINYVTLSATPFDSKAFAFSISMKNIKCLSSRLVSSCPLCWSNCDIQCMDFGAQCSTPFTSSKAYKCGLYILYCWIFNILPNFCGSVLIAARDSFLIIEPTCYS